VITRDELARVIGDLVLQTLEQQAQIAALKKKIAETNKLGTVDLSADAQEEKPE
jgi:hypothetical protein